MKTTKRKASMSHDQSLRRELRNDPAFAAEYLRALANRKTSSGKPRKVLKTRTKAAKGRRAFRAACQRQARGGIATQVATKPQALHRTREQALIVRAFGERESA